jgi:hypothetical protein
MPSPFDDNDRILADWAREQLAKIAGRIEGSEDRFGQFLDPAVVLAADAVLAHPIFSNLAMPRKAQLIRREKEIRGAYLLLGSRTAFEPLESFVTRVRELVEQAGVGDDSRFSNMLTQWWRDDVWPSWGVYRYNGRLSHEVTEIVRFGGLAPPRLPRTPRGSDGPPLTPG